MEHGARSRSGSFFNFNGTAGVWRRRAIDEAGGWQHDTLTEDTDLSYRAQLRGWRFLYLPDVECASELPVEMNAFKAQQARWAKGLMQTAIKILPRMMRSDEPGRIKAESIFHLTANISYPFMVVLSTLLLPAMIVRFYQGWFQMLFIDLPLFIASSCSISGFYLTSQRVLYPKTWKRSILYMPFVMAVGIGLSVRNAKAVIEALMGVKSEFVRTPKFRIEGQAGTWKKKLYRNRSGWMPWLEIALGLYFASTIVYSIQNENYATAPFLFLFVWGFLYTGVMSVAQGWIERLRFGAQPGSRVSRSSRLRLRRARILVAQTSVCGVTSAIPGATREPRLNPATKTKPLSQVQTLQPRRNGNPQTEVCATKSILTVPRLVPDGSLRGRSAGIFPSRGLPARRLRRGFA